MAEHKLLFLDFESYYDSEYSLTKLTPPEYILDPRWETIGCAFAEWDQPFRFVDGPDVAGALAHYDPARTTTVTFNALFDNCVAAWRYGFIPHRMLCAMRMAVALRGHTLHSASLKSVARCLKVGEKGTEIENARGKHRADLMADPAQWRAYQAYACNDGELCRAIFAILAPEFPSTERRVMDLVLRCAVEPRFKIDQQMLSEHLVDLEKDKIRMLRLANGATEEELDAAGLDLGDDTALQEELDTFASSLRSNTKFEALLKARGVDIEYKASLSDPTNLIPAFAKTDEFMANLQEHSDPIVQALAAGRLGVRSTIEQSRGKRIMQISSLPWPAWVKGNMPIPLRYSGAHTHRLSGDWKINMQNLPAGRGKNKSKLRKALCCGDDEDIVVVDKSQIECRIAAWLCGQRDLLEDFRSKGDPYSTLASKVFGFKVDKKIHLIERFIGKTGVLGLGFGCGKDKFYNMVVRSARTLGMDMSKLLAIWTPDLAAFTVDVYRSANTGITGAWRTLDMILKSAWIGVSAPVKWGPVTIGEGYVLLPNSMKMLYDIVKPIDASDLRYRYGKREHRMYGPKLLENIVQALARIDIMNTALRCNDRGFRFVLQSHDELAFIVPRRTGEDAKTIILEEFRRPPSWAKILPLDAEGNVGASYADAK